LIHPILAGKEVLSTGMTREVERCEEALRLAASGKKVALISSGDAGIYGMAGLIFELLEKSDDQSFQALDVAVIPGVSAVQAAAAALGAPLMHDFALISLSDLLTPWELIQRRLFAAATADFVVALYNPKSKGRTRQIEEARDILLTARPESTPVGIVRNACREGEEKVVTTLGDMLSHDVDMFSLVIIGNSATFVDQKGRMVTPRGYAAKGQDPGDGNALPNADGTSLMFCGTGSDVGKSVLTAGFCRILKNRGYRVAPYKSQNMALNSAVTPEGGEVGRAQAVQAEACGLAVHTDMNPILLKPNSDTGSQIIIQGKAIGTMSVREYNAFKPKAFIKASESFQRLRSAYDIVVIEGAGSIAEINLKATDIANLTVASMAGAPVILVADIDRGGVFAQIVGTIELLTSAERAMVKGIIINKFRGDPSLLQPGIDYVEKRTGVSVLGVVPYFTGFSIPEEDSVALARKGRGEVTKAKGERLRIGVVKLSRISNFTDFEIFEREPDVELTYVEGVNQLAGLDLLILPGSKATIADFYFLMERGLYEPIRNFKGFIVGICGGYQMLGRRLFDPHHVESHIKEAVGLGLLDAETVITTDKVTQQVTAELLPAGQALVPACTERLNGYEIHMGETSLGGDGRPFARITRRSHRQVEINDGCVSPDGRVFGTYLHGIFDNDGFRRAFLNNIRMGKGMVLPVADPSTADRYDMLAEHLEKHIDVERVLNVCGVVKP
jgi:adenosylcobyric acid synthase